MWYSVLILLVNCANFTVSRDMPEIIIPVKRYNTDIYCDQNRIVSPKLFLNEHFTISVQSDVDITTGHCYHPTSPNKCIVDNFKRKHGVYVPTKDLKAENMEKHLTCEFSVFMCSPEAKQKQECSQDITQKNYESSISCNITIDVRDPDKGYLTVNGVRQKTYMAQTKSEVFDAYGIYDYFEGQSASFACQLNNKKVTHYLKMSYYTAKGIWSRTDEVPPKKYSQLYIKLTRDFQNGYIECTLSDMKRTESVVIRLLLSLKLSFIDFGFQVNGLILPPYQDKDKNIIYQYEYDINEELTVQSLKDDTKYGAMKCNGKGMANELAEFEDWTGDNLYFKLRLQDKHLVTSLECTVSKLNNSVVESFSLKMIPNLQAMYYYPFITGLSMANVLLKFNSTKLNTIHYEYEDEKLLNLTCYSNIEAPNWEYNTSKVENTFPSISLSNEVYTIGEFKLKADARNASISCWKPPGGDHLEEITEITLIRRDNRGDVFIDISKDKTKKVWFLVCPVLLIIVILAWAIFKYTKTKRHKSNVNPRDLSYENLPGHNEGPMSVPNQWNEAMYAIPADAVAENSLYAQPYHPKAADETYAKPIPKHLRGRPTQSKHEEAAYATVGDTGPIYAEVLAKSSRAQNYNQASPKGINGSKLNQSHISKGKMSLEESPYAEIVPTKSPYAEIALTQRPYAEVSFLERPYAEVSSVESPYAEVSSHESPYAEVSSLESPYAEVESNKKKIM